MCSKLCFTEASSGNERVEAVLRKKVFKDYDKDIRPVNNESQAVDLTVNLDLFQIIKLV